MWQIDPLLDALTKSLNVTAMRQTVHATNLANAAVSDYQRLEVRFDPELAMTPASEIRSSDLVKAAAAQPEVVPAADQAVQLDQEVARMSGNAVRYQALLGAFEKTISLMRYAAREGREG